MENMSVPRQLLVRNFGVTWPHLDQNDSTSSDTGFFKGLQGGMDGWRGQEGQFTKLKKKGSLFLVFAKSFFNDKSN